MAENAPATPDAIVQPVVIRPWPKIIMMLPTLIVAVVCGVITVFAAKEAPADDGAFLFIHAVNLVFLLVLFVNLVLLLYDLSLRGFLIVMLTIAVIVLVLFLLNLKGFEVGRTLRRVLSLRVYANAAFYFVFAVVLFVNLVIAWVITRFHYWVVERNEIIIHNGFMHEQERHPTSTARFRLQIDDVVEYALFGAGKLVFTFTDDKTERVLPTILRVRPKAKQLDLLLGRVAVTEQ
ncbi:MAG: hypothetical protein HRF43_16290 [Phycisphaerae bacterium]